MQGRELVDHIMRHGTVPSGSLAASMGVKERAMRKRILQANDDMAGCARIVYKRSPAGYTLEVLDQEAFDAWLSEPGRFDLSAAVPTTPPDRVKFLLQDLLFRSDWITLEKLSSMLFVSRSTLSNDLKLVEREIERFGLQLEKRPHHGVLVTGSEMGRRICLASVAVDASLENDPARETADAGELDVISHCVDEVAAQDEIKINPVAHHNLIVHIAIALARIRQGCYVPANPDQAEEMRGTREYRAAAHIAERIVSEFDVELPDSEVAYIAIHLASKRLLDTSADGADTVEDGSGNLVISDEAWSLAAEMLEAVWRAFRFDFRYDVELRMNLARHLMPLSVRLRYHMTLENALLPDIKQRFPLAYAMALDACGVLAAHFGTTPSEEEAGYIALAFALALERSKEEPERKNLLVVCASGRGTAHLLAYEVEHRFEGHIGSIETCDVEDFARRDLSGIDYVLTTVKLDRHVNIPVIEVSVFLNERDSEDIKSALERGTNVPASRFFDPDLFFPHLSFADKAGVLAFLSARMAERDDVRDDLEQLVLKREETGATSFGNLVALPHPYGPASDRTQVSVGLLDSPVDWDGKPVRAVFLICISDDASVELESFYKSMVGLLTNSESIQRLLSSMRFETLMDELEGGRHD